ncbi:MAG TPA: fumarylacetoacetate hydrolase family protein [Xanthobacteraceae bacterium]|nr:fumarylacetoacetate hydrolase family protein [Xanthobacteraceae bacterium]
MRLVTFLASGAERLGALVSENRQIVDFAGAHDGGDPAFASMQAFIAEGEDALYRARNIIADARRTGRGLIDSAAVKLLAPLPLPAQMRDFLCFEKHLLQSFARLRQLRAAAAPDPEKALREMEAQGTFSVPKIWYERPSFYKPSRFAVCGTGQDVAWPAYSQTIDYELEFACVIGTAGRDIPKDKARAHIFGYTIFNDLSARDEQSQEMLGNLGPGKGKDFDNSNPLGPCVVTADEIPDPYALEMIVRVNGEERGRGNSREMHWKYEDCIAFVSRSETIHPGELFCSGTVGNGSGLETGRFLDVGDVVELEVEKIGVLRNRIVR